MELQLMSETPLPTAYHRRRRRRGAARMNKEATRSAALDSMGEELLEVEVGVAVGEVAALRRSRPSG